MRCGCRCAPTGSRFIRSSKRPDCPRWLSNLMEGIDRGIVQRLHGPPGPADLNAVDLAPIAETEVHDAARLSQVAARRAHLPDHHAVPGPEPDQGADRIPVAPGSRQSERDVVPPGKPVGEKRSEEHTSE